MTKIKKYKNSVEHFLSGESGQRFFNFAYSIGAAIVIWGALFKILHLPGGNMLLSIGMGTEVLMFVLTAFDRPPKQYNWEEVFPVLDTKNPEDRPDLKSGAGVVINGTVNADKASGAPVVGGNVASGMSSSVPQAPANMAEAMQQYMAQMADMAEQMKKLRDTTEALNKVSDVLLQSYSAVTQNSEEISSASVGYVDQMKDLSRNIGGLNTIYEIQLKSVASQLDSIDRVNRGIKDIRDMYEKGSQHSAQYCAEVEKMTRNMQQLNAVYEKVITAMTINMYRPMMGADPNPVPDVTAEPINNNTKNA